MPTKTATSSRKTAGKPGTTSINVPLPTALHRKVRAKGVAKGQTLGDSVVEALTAWAK